MCVVRPSLGCRRKRSSPHQSFSFLDVRLSHRFFLPRQFFHAEKRESLLRFPWDCLHAFLQRFCGTVPEAGRRFHARGPFRQVPFLSPLSFPCSCFTQRCAVSHFPLGFDSRRLQSRENLPSNVQARFARGSRSQTPASGPLCRLAFSRSVPWFPLRTRPLRGLLSLRLRARVAAVHTTSSRRRVLRGLGPARRTRTLGMTRKAQLGEKPETQWERAAQAAGVQTLLAPREARRRFQFPFAGPTWTKSLKT